MKGIETNRLTWNKKTRTFITEASDIGLRASQIPSLKYAVRNPKSGNHRIFEHCMTERNKEDGTLGWIYRNYDDPAKPLTLVIFND